MKREVLIFGLLIGIILLAFLWGTLTGNFVAGEFKVGDLNKDNFFSQEDIDFITNYIFRGGSSPDPLSLADINDDGSINIADTIYYTKFIYTNGPGPVNSEGDVDCVDKDGGTNYFVKSNSNILGGSPQDNKEDYCVNEFKIAEAVCAGSDTFYVLYECSYGCEDGICLEGETPVNPTMVDGCNELDNRVKNKVRELLEEGEIVVTTEGSMLYQGQYVILNNGEGGDLVKISTIRKQSNYLDDQIYIKDVFLEGDVLDENVYSVVWSEKAIGTFSKEGKTYHVSFSRGPDNAIDDYEGIKITWSDSGFVDEFSCDWTTQTEDYCNDSDGGINYFIAGHIYTSASPGTKIEDYCLDNTHLIERHCLGENPNNFTINYNCPFGCSNGACELTNSSQNENQNNNQITDFCPTIFVKRGDLNADGMVNSGDSVIFSRYISSKETSLLVPFSVLDVNGDGNVNIGDTVYLNNYIWKSGPAPVGGDVELSKVKSRTRVMINGQLKFCNPINLNYEKVKALDVPCVEDYECESNVCLDGVCTSLKAELEKQGGLLKKIWCALTNPVSVLKRDKMGQTTINNPYLGCVYGDSPNYDTTTALNNNVVA